MAEYGTSDFLKRALGYCYRRTVRRLMPVVGPVRYSGIAISRNKRLGDDFLPRFLPPHNVADIHDYEGALARGISAHVKAGDKVVIVGGGEGVTVALAAKAAGDSGSVTCFEGSKTYVEKSIETANRNDIADRVKIVHAIVGENISVYGEDEDLATSLIGPGNLPECNVLELDCEGAETKILSQMTMRPKVVLVETHGLHGAPTHQVRELLEARGYEVEDLGWAEPSRLDDCEQNDIRVLAAVLAFEPDARPAPPSL
jgi:hypothetical protein